jgi:hypothetical protein
LNERPVSSVPFSSSLFNLNSVQLWMPVLSVPLIIGDVLIDPANRVVQFRLNVGTRDEYVVHRLGERIRYDRICRGLWTGDSPSRL